MGDAVVVDGGDGSTPNLRFALPGDLGALVKLLRADRPTHVELHHMLGHDQALFRLAPALGVPYDVYIHDYAWFCPRIALVQEHSYCGEPAISACEDCVADFGSNTEEPISVAALVERSAQLLQAARRVVVPAPDVATFVWPGIFRSCAWRSRRGRTIWRSRRPRCRRRVRRVCVVGGVGVEKGYEVLLACVRDAGRRRLPLEFVLVGHSRDDDRLLGAGPIMITGRYDPLEVESLIRAQNADIALLAFGLAGNLVLHVGPGLAGRVARLVFSILAHRRSVSGGRGGGGCCHLGCRLRL